jgi:hypothetical protein
MGGRSGPRTNQLGLAKMAVPLVSFHQADHKGDNGDDGKYEEQNFGDFDRASGNATKAEHGCDQCNHEKYDRIVKHVSSWKGAALELRRSRLKHLLQD